jgi:type VI secretion system secreted protein Hcp
MNWGDTMPPEIKGDVTDGKHAGWIELESVQTSGGGTHSIVSGYSKPSHTEIIVTKEQDSASPGLFRAALGAEGKKVVIHLVKDVGGAPKIYLVLTLTGAYVSRYSVSGKQDKPKESLSINFQKIEWGYADAVTPHAAPPPSTAWQLGEE